MNTLTTVLRGGELSKGSWLYRFLAHWTPEHAPKMEDSCQLRAALILAGLRILKKPAIWALLAVAAMTALALIVLALGLTGLIVGEFAYYHFPFTIPAKLYDDSFSNPLPVVLVHFGGLGIGAVILTAIPLVVIGFGVWKAMQRWSIIEPLFYLALAIAVCIFAGWTLFTKATFKDLVGIVFTVVFTVAIVGGVWGVYLAVTRLRRWFAETYFWAWLKGHLCLPVQLTE